MPWCDPCDSYRSPNALDAEGNCRTCGGVADTAAVETRTRPGVPWHFWVLVAALAAYLGWRVIQAVVWVVT